MHDRLYWSNFNVSYWEKGTTITLNYNRRQNNKLWRIPDNEQKEGREIKNHLSTNLNI